MGRSDATAEDVETEIRQVRDSLPAGGIAQGTTVTRMMTLDAAMILKGRAQHQPILIGEPNDDGIAPVTIGPVPVFTNLEG